MFFRTRHARWEPVGTIRGLIEVTFGNSGHVMILILGPRTQKLFHNINLLVSLQQSQAAVESLSDSRDVAGLSLSHA